ncbi:MAG: outer membrane protein assembly factor BamE [Phyllobacteriaceae bacterium]|nr:outer membrane protein assembly factor BamE [Phyllobacteriaceae bacterium]
MSVSVTRFKGVPNMRKAFIVATLAASSGLAGCTGVADSLKPRQNITNGYVVDQQTLDLVPVGSSREQVLLALGSPSTVNTIDGKEAFYYISQQRTRPAAFAKARLVSQRVLAVYMGEDGKVSQIADYGLQDGKLFDFVTRTTPTGGADSSFLVGVIRGLAGTGASGGGAQAARGVMGI